MTKLTGYDLWEWMGSPRYVLAPMIDMSELSFRVLCRRYGVKLAYTPMIHSGQFLMDTTYNKSIFQTAIHDSPLIAQFCANDANIFLRAAEQVSSQCVAIDLNLGCPQTIAKKGRYGAYLQEDLELVSELVHRASRELPVPITCKIRILDGPVEKTVQYAQMLENCGCSVLAVHARTREQRGEWTGLASWETIREVKRKLGIPVIANGNILSIGDVHRCLQETGADAVMSAEGLLHNPALFSGQNPLVWDMVEEYLQIAQDLNTSVKSVRTHLFRLLKHSFVLLPELRTRLARANSISRFRAVCDLIRDTLLARKIQEEVFHGDLSCKEPRMNYDLPVWMCHSRPRVAVPSHHTLHQRDILGRDEREDREMIDPEKLCTLDLTHGTQAVNPTRREYRSQIWDLMLSGQKPKKGRNKKEAADKREPGGDVRRCSKRQECETIRERMTASLSSTPIVCLDLAFSALMTNKEQDRLASQIRRLYGANRRSPRPLHLVLCGLLTDSLLYQLCCRKNDGFANYIVEMREESPFQLYCNSSLVYLTPDSSTPLTELEEEKVYIIGGIVDETIQKMTKC